MSGGGQCPVRQSESASTYQRMEFFDLVVTQVSRLTIIPEVKRQGKGGKLRNLLTLTPRRRKTNRARKREKISFENVKKKKRKGTKTGGPWVRGGYTYGHGMISTLSSALKAAFPYNQWCNLRNFGKSPLQKNPSQLDSIPIEIDN